jgi:hypothetical protein|tara:strand:- start:2165 stop:2305 length:141 start_codon:yes stop_codon:yes gene_type:complete
MGFDRKGLHPYPVDADPARVTDKLAKKIAGNAADRVKDNTLCKQCK